MAIRHHAKVTTRRKGRSRFDPILYRLLAKADPDLSQEKIDEAIKYASEKTSKAVAKNLRERSRSMLIDHASIRAGFEIRLRDVWGEALDALYAVYVGGDRVGGGVLLPQPRRGGRRERRGMGGPPPGPRASLPRGQRDPGAPSVRPCGGRPGQMANPARAQRRRVVPLRTR